MPSPVIVRRVCSIFVLVALLETTSVTQSSPPYRFPTGVNYWSAAVADLDGDGTKELILATMDGGRFNELTFKTPIIILGVANGRVVDRTTELFGEPRPTSWNATITTGDFDGNGAIDLMLCDRGRNVGPNPPPGNVLIDGVRGAQNEVLLNRDGKLRLTDGFPRMVTSSWGCSAGDVDRSGRATIAISSFYSGMGHDRGFLLTWDGASRFIQTRTLPAPAVSAVGWNATATADFDGNGYADVSGAQQVYWHGPGVRSGALPLEQAAIEREGFDFWRTTLTADFTGDGLPDLVKVNSRGAPTLSDARFVMYRGDRQDGLVQKLDAFPATSTYNGNDYSERVTALDVNFDGTLDIVSLGWVYTSFSGGAQPPTAVWLNDGTGRFRQARWSDSIQAFATCDNTQAFVLGTANPKEFHLIYGGCGLGYMARTVNEARPLTFSQ
jgi:hypothetical protein